MMMNRREEDSTSNIERRTSNIEERYSSLKVSAAADSMLDVQRCERSELNSRTLLSIFLLFLASSILAQDYATVDPNWMPSKLYFFGGALRPRVMDLIADKDAPTGSAAYSKAGVKEGGGWADSYTYETIPGKYRTTFYLKVADNTSDKGVTSYYVHGNVINDPRANADGDIYLKASDFKSPGTYETFIYEWDYLEHSFMVVGGTWLGAVDMWWGGAKTELLEPYSDDKVMDIWKNPPKQKFYGEFPPKGVKIPPEIPEIQIRHDVPRVFVVEGMYYDRFGLEEAVASIPGAVMNGCSTSSNAQANDIAPSFPQTDELFKDYNIIVLANVDIRRLGVLRRYIIRKFVEKGGGLLVLGGPWTYGRCAMKGTAVDEILPVTTKGKTDWIKLPDDSSVEITQNAPDILKGVKFENAPVLCYIHDLQVKNNGTIFMTAGGKPVLVGAEIGLGRTAAFAGTAMGETAKGNGIWESKEWPSAMAGVLKWLSGGK